jgi:hypothetical protein
MKFRIKRIKEKSLAVLLALTILSFIAVPAVDEGRAIYTEFMGAANFIEPGIRYSDAPNISILAEGQKIFLPDQQIEGGIVCYTIPEGFGVHNPVRINTDSFVESTEGSDPQFIVAGLKPSLHFKYSPNAQLLPIDKNSRNGNKIAVNKVNCDADISYRSGLGTEISNITITPAQQDVLIVIKSPGGGVVNFFQYISVKPVRTVTPRLYTYLRNPIIVTSEPIQRDFYQDRIARVIEFRNAYIKKIYEPNYRSGGNNAQLENVNSEYDDYELVANEMRTFLEAPGTNMPDSSRNLALQIFDLINNEAISAYQRIDNSNNQNSDDKTGFGLMMLRIIDILKERVLTKNNTITLYNPNASFLRPVTPSPTTRPSTSSSAPRTSPNASSSISRTTSPAKPSSSSSKLTSPSVKPSVRPSYVDARVMYTELMAAADFIKSGILYYEAPNVSRLGKEDKIFLPDQKVPGGIACYSLPEGFDANKPVRIITDSYIHHIEIQNALRDNYLNVIRDNNSLHARFNNNKQLLPVFSQRRDSIKISKIDCSADLQYVEDTGTVLSNIRITQPEQDVLIVLKNANDDVVNFFQYISIKPQGALSPRTNEFPMKPIIIRSGQIEKEFYRDRIERGREFQNVFFRKVYDSHRNYSPDDRRLTEDLAEYQLVANKLKVYLQSPDTQFSDDSRNLALQIHDLIEGEARKALLSIDGKNDDNVHGLAKMMLRIFGIFQQQLISKDKPRLLFNPKANFYSKAVKQSATSSNTSSRLSSPTTLISSPSPSPSPLTPTEARERNIRRNIFFRGLDKNNSKYDKVVVNLEGEVLYEKTCFTNNSYVAKLVTRKTEGYDCNPQDISDINVDSYDRFNFDEALKRHNVNPDSPLAFELFKRLIGAMRTYYAFTSQNNLYYGEKYYPNVKQEKNYYKLISNRNDNFFTTDYGVYAEIEGQGEKIVRFNTNQYYIFSLLTDPDFNKLFMPLSVSSIVASYHAERDDIGSIIEGHRILGRGLKNIKPAYFYNTSRFDSARINFNDFPNDPDLPKIGYYYTNYPAYQRNIEDFGIRVGSYVNVNGVRERVSNIKFFSGALEVGQYVPSFPLFYHSTYAMGKTSSNFCTVDLRESTDSFSSIVIPTVAEVLKSGNRIGFTCPNISDGTNIKVIFNYPQNARDRHNFKRPPNHYAYFKVNNLPVALARDSGKAIGRFVSFDLIEAEGYTQADLQRGEVLINGLPCRFATEAVVHSRLRQSPQAIDSRFGNQINTSGYCQFRGDDLLKMRMTKPAGENGPTWEGKAVLEDFRKNFIVDKSAPLKKNFATNLGKLSKDGYYGDQYKFPFGPDYWLKTNLGDLVFKGDYIYLYDSAKDKYDPIYVANWQYNDSGKYDTFRDSDAYDILNPILAERGSNFFEAHTATISPYLPPSDPKHFNTTRRQAVSFYAAGVKNVKSILVNVSGINYVCGDITTRKDSQVHCNFGGLNVDRTCSAAQVSYDLKRSDKFLEGKAPMMNSCSVSITTKDNKVIKLPLVEEQSIHRDRVESRNFYNSKNVYEETLADRIYYVGSRPLEYLRLSGGYAAFGNSTVTVNGKPCIKPENVALGKVDEVGCYFKWDGTSNEVVATIRIDGHNIRTKVVTIEKIDFNNIQDKTLRDIGVNRFEGSFNNSIYPIQGIKSVKAGARNCDFPILTLPASGTVPRMTIPYDRVCYFDIPVKASYVPTNNATILTHEGQSLSLPFTEKGFSSNSSGSETFYTVVTSHDYQEIQGKYNKPLIIGQNPLIANTCEQACLSAGYIFDKANYNQAFCSSYASSRVNTSYGGASNGLGGGCQRYYTSNFFSVTEHVSWSNYSSNVPYKLSTRDSDGRVCRCVSY